jgi:hypothetical protein
MPAMNDSMKQYEKATEEMLKTRPKHPKPYGIKQPDSRNVIALIAGIFFVIAVVASIMK